MAVFTDQSIILAENQTKFPMA